MRVVAERIDLAGKSTSILSGVSLHAETGEWLTIVGPNGAGKSSLLRCLAGVVEHAGSVTIGDANLASTNTRDRARMLAYLPQRFDFPPGLSVHEFVMLGRSPHRAPFGKASDDDHDAVADALSVMELSPLANRYSDSLSGGELQRVRLAQVLVQQTPVVLLDEPTASLDIGHAQQLLDLLSDLSSEKQLTVVLTMHDLSLAGQYGNRMVMLAQGKIVANGSADSVLTELNLLTYYGAHVEVIRGHRGVSILPVRDRTSGQAYSG